MLRTFKTSLRCCEFQVWLVDKFPIIRFKDGVHRGLKGGWGISQAKMLDYKFIDFGEF